MALTTSSESPAALRTVSGLVGEWIGRLGSVWVEAEIAQLNRRPGICFLVLRDLEAKVSMNAKCHVSVLDKAVAPITEGARIIAHAKPEFYGPNGSLSLSINEIRAAGIGELLAQLERRRQLLAAEGLFDPRLRKDLPFLPRGIGLITGKDSAAERDVLQNARLRWPAAPFAVRHALMQGPQSASDVIKALRDFDEDPAIDVIVIARGGGSVEDLLSFSDEALVRAVAACSTPVVSAIGHEPDTPIVDLVADLRASTPTDAAKRIVPDMGEERLMIDQACARIRRAVGLWISRERQHLDNVVSRPVMTSPGAIIQLERERLNDAVQRSRRAISTAVIGHRNDIGNQLARVKALSPQATLERGYAIAFTTDGRQVTSHTDASVGDALRIRVSDGSFVTTITEHEDLS